MPSSHHDTMYNRRSKTKQHLPGFFYFLSLTPCLGHFTNQMLVFGDLGMRFNNQLYFWCVCDYDFYLNSLELY